MARKPRIHYVGAFYHVMLRGNAGQLIFLDDQDRSHFSLLIQENICKYRCKVHAFCFMSNHVHLLIEVADITLSKIIHNIAFRYATWLNKKNQKNGHIFQGRFKAILIDTDVYLLELVRYIHLNPVRAKLIDHPNEEWWSSHFDYLGKCTFPWITCERVLLQINKKLSKARILYEEFIFSKLINYNSQINFQSGMIDKRVLGDDAFVEKIKICHYVVVSKLKVDLDAIVFFVSDLYSIPKLNISCSSKAASYVEARAIIAWLTAEFKVCTFREVASFLKRDETTLSRKIKQLHAKKPEKLTKIKERFYAKLQA